MPVYVPNYTPTFAVWLVPFFAYLQIKVRVPVDEPGEEELPGAVHHLGVPDGEVLAYGAVRPNTMTIASTSASSLFHFLMIGVSS